MKVAISTSAGCCSQEAAITVWHSQSPPECFPYHGAVPCPGTQHGHKKQQIKHQRAIKTSLGHRFKRITIIAARTGLKLISLAVVKPS